ncbi:very short patch repair endonuclease [Patescibacteria group bacterium]
MDIKSKKERSYNMSQIRDKNTRIEKIFRNYIWMRGIKNYRLHYKITGRPDIFFPKKKIAVFIDGCFWHRCSKCFREPESNRIFWKKKLENNKKRDKIVNRKLGKKGIMVIRFWEHQIKTDIHGCYNKLRKGMRFYQ